MRAFLPLSVILILLAPLSEGARPVVPTLTLTIDPASTNATSSPDNPVGLVFYGTAAVDKLPLERAVVTLTCAVDTGWEASVTPSQMVFTGATPEQYTCYVIIPKGTPNTTGALKVTGMVVANNLHSTASVTATITVNRTVVSNSTAGNRTTNTTSGSGAKAAISLPVTVISAVIIVAAVVGVGAFAVFRRKRGRKTDEGSRGR